MVLFAEGGPKKGSFRACKRFNQSATSAKLSSLLRLFIEAEKDFINRLQALN
jgi:hypothetical protein